MPGTGQRWRTRLLTEEQHRFLVRAYQKHTLRESINLLNSKFGLTLSKAQAKGYCDRNKIYAGSDGRRRWLASTFKTGHRPWNKGRKDWMKTKKGYPNIVSTQFKPGHVALNTKPTGSERINSYGYPEIKIDAINPYSGYRGVWQRKSFLVWEQANGPIPKGYAVVHVDGNRLNCALENLALLSRRELLALNGRIPGSNGVEIGKARIAQAKLLVAIDKRIT